MKAPPGLLSGALALWGYTSGHWALAIGLAVIIELARWSPVRFDIGQRDFVRLAMASRVAFLCIVAFRFTQGAVPEALLAALTWLPLALAISLVPQLYSVGGLAPINVLSMSRADDRDRPGVDLSMPFFGVTLLAAAGGTQESAVFFPALALVVGWALAALGPLRRDGARPSGAWTTWLLCYGLVLALALAAHTGLSSLQRLLEEEALPIVYSWMGSQTRSDRSRTRIGDLGRVSLSEQIIMRVEHGTSLATPFLVTDGTYSQYESGAWKNPGIRTVALALREGSGKAEFFPGAGELTPGQAASITLRPRGRTAVMPAPLGTVAVQIEGDPTITWNGRGALAAASSPAVLRYRALVDPTATAHALPDEDDLAIPPMLRAHLDAVYEELRIDGLEGSAAVQAIRLFFGHDFRYTLFLGDRRSGGRSLADFLLHDRAGHCEYFASATVLLLRRAGIPARYATGYLVEEWSPLEQQYVVRGTHGHAWAVAYVGGRWTDIDTTPPVWRNLDAGSGSAWFTRLRDVWALAMLRFDQWREPGRSADPRIWTGLAIATLIVACLLGTRRIRRKAVDSKAMPPLDVDFTPAPFGAIEAYFSSRGARRHRGSSVRSWVSELQATGHLTGPAAEALTEIVALHYRQRFGGMQDRTDHGHHRVREAMARWLAERRDRRDPLRQS